MSLDNMLGTTQPMRVNACGVEATDWLRSSKLYSGCPLDKQLEYKKNCLIGWPSVKVGGPKASLGATAALVHCIDNRKRSIGGNGNDATISLSGVGVPAA